MIEGFRRRSTRRSAVGIAALAVCVAFAAIAATAAVADPPPALFAGGMNGIVFAHGAHGNPHHGSSPLLLDHGGPVLAQGADVTPIFWGSSWTDTNTKVTGIDTFYSGVGGTSYAQTNGEYSGSNGPVSTTVVDESHLTDLSAAPTRAPSTTDVLAIVAANIGNKAVANGYYPVYSDQPRGHAGYCAWHSWGTIGSTPVQFAFFFNLDGDPGCDPQDTQTGHSQGLAALGNVSGHELSETLTDPNGNAWYDSSGAENADKCAWKFSGNVVTFSNRTQWKIQGNWSNNAYNAGTGYTIGCIDGS